MRLTLYIVALMGVVQVYAQSFCDSTLMNQNTQSPRSEIIAYEKWHDFAKDDLLASKYVYKLYDWLHPTEDQQIFESKFTCPFSWVGRQLYVRVEGVSSSYTLSVNGQEIGRVQNGASPAEFNITRGSVEGRNVVTLTLDPHSGAEAIEGWNKRSTEPMVGEVYVMSQPTQMIRDIWVESSLSGGKIHSKVNVAIKSHVLNPRTSTIHYSLYSADGTLVTFGHRDVTLEMRGEEVISFATSIDKSEGWSAESPNRYLLRVKTQYEGRYLEYHSYNIGFNVVDYSAESGQLKVNGSAVDLVAKSVVSDLDPSQVAILKDNGFNAIRIAAGAHSRELYEACDREGMYIISPMPINSSRSSKEITKGGNPSNDPKWWGAYMQRIDVGYHSAKLHPSVIAFSLADDSQNGYNLYEGYLRLKGLAEPRPVVYFESDEEWNSDKLELKGEL
ncbi:MAG: glycoside hydrolase family 2 TIM barrel-domain containing protein [Rikenellaceae bacterium]